MSTMPSTSSRPDFASIFDAALERYRRKTKNDLASHPLFPTLQYCDSPEAIFSVFREQIPAFNRFQNIDDRFTKWVIPTVNVLHAFSDTLSQVVGLSFPPANLIFVGIGVLLSAAKDASACQDKLIDIFNRIERFFQRLDIYTGITPTTTMTDMVVEIMVEVINILAITTKQVKSGRLKLWLKKLIGNSDIEDSMEKLDKLTQEESRMALAELRKVTHRVEGEVMGIDSKVEGVDDRVKYVDGKVQDVLGGVQDVGNRVQGVEEGVQDVQSDVKVVGNIVRTIGSDMKDISSEVRDVGDNVDEVKRNQLRDSILRWLSPPDPSINHYTAREAHHEGTAQWFFQGSIFSQWKSSSSFLWIHGKPGSGKSILCSSIIQNIIAFHGAGRASMAYFYFDFRDVNKQKLGNLLPALLIQLSARSDPCCDILSRLYSAHNRGAQKPSDRAMVECLKEMLNLEAQAPTYVIIDALDECPISSTIPGPSPRKKVLEFVAELVDLHLPNLHICVTSRPEHDIRVVLERLTKHPMSLHDESGQQEDIANYVTSFVCSDQRMRRWREEDKDLVIKTLSEKAGGMFRWVFCQLEVLRYCLPPSVRGVLDDLPESLDETYERILREIKKPNKEYALRLLQCLVVSVRPLLVEELAEILVFDFDDGEIPKPNLDWRLDDQEEAIMSACSNLVIIVNYRRSRIVQFSHFSVKEFLTAKRLAEPIREISRYHIRLDAAHTILVRACLGTLFEYRRSYSDMVKDFPLFLYATCYWDTHARFEDVSLRVKEGIIRLFDTGQPHFGTWLHSSSSMTKLWNSKPRAVPLYIAAKVGIHVAAEHIIAEHPEQINSKDENHADVTPMHAAAEGGYADVLSLLLEHGANVDVQDKMGQTPLHRASEVAKLEAAKCLLDHGADINARLCYGTPLHIAAHQGYVEFARMLLGRGAKINSRNFSRETPLHVAAQTGRTQVVQLLLEYGADVNARDREGGTPLKLASESRFKQQEVLKLLSKYGAEPEPVE